MTEDQAEKLNYLLDALISIAVDLGVNQEAAGRSQDEELRLMWSKGATQASARVTEARLDVATYVELLTG